jgi:hypothetical protein
MTALLRQLEEILGHYGNISKGNISKIPLWAAVTREIESTASEILTAEGSLRYWTDVLNGTAEGPQLTDPDSMSDDELTRLLGYRTTTYARQIRNSIRGLPPHVTEHTINTFRNL